MLFKNDAPLTRITAAMALTGAALLSQSAVACGSSKVAPTDNLGFYVWLADFETGGGWWEIGD